jgi:diaminohydroxyphosphoribosylaminopyrimidine deaminase/5-amino-6-(5-phosphoribosylamino)uracil reductase
MALGPEDYMARALALAARGRGRTSPNPVVGAVVVSADGVIVGQGYHERPGDAHAEVRALERAGDAARGATMYCTLEPCCHSGRTGPCVERIVSAGVARVVAAVEDPFPLVQGRGFAFLRAHGVAVDVGLGAAAASALNQPFFTLVREGRPFVILKAALSRDGFMAATRERSTKLTSAQADRHAQRARGEVDALGVGVGTIIADDPLLTARGVYRERPLVRVVFDRHLRVPLASRVLSTPDLGPVIIVTTAEASRDRRAAVERAGVDVIVAADSSVRAALTCLGERQISSLMLEGGARLQRAACDEDAVDFVRVYRTPVMIGGSGVPFLDGRPFDLWALLERRTRMLGPDELIEGYVHRPH